MKGKNLNLSQMHLIHLMKQVMMILPVSYLFVSPQDPLVQMTRWTMHFERTTMTQMRQTESLMTLTHRQMICLEIH